MGSKLKMRQFWSGGAFFWVVSMLFQAPISAAERSAYTVVSLPYSSFDQKIKKIDMQNIDAEENHFFPGSVNLWNDQMVIVIPTAGKMMKPVDFCTVFVKEKDPKKRMPSTLAPCNLTKKEAARLLKKPAQEIEILTLFKVTLTPKEIKKLSSLSLK